MSHGLDINKKEPQVVRIPFIDEEDLRPEFETSLAKDRYFLNGIFEAVKNPLSQEIEYHFIKRPGIQTSSMGTSALGHSLFYSVKNDKSYFAVGTKLFADNTDLNVVTNGSTLIPTKLIGITDTRPGATPYYVGVNDGTSLFLIAADNSVIVMNNVVINSSSAANPTTITTATAHNLLTGNKVIIRNHTGSTPSINDTIYTITKTGATTFTIPVNVTAGGVGGTIGVFPAPNTGDLIYMDGYWFTSKSDGTIWNCSVDDPTTWPTTNFITSLMLSGLGVGLARQNNMLVAMSNKHFQLFIDAANPTGSPLQNVEQGMQQIGCFDNQSIAFTENAIFWVSTTPAGGLSVYRLEGTTNLKDIGNFSLRRILAKTIGSSLEFIANGMILRFNGHIFYLLNITTSSASLETFSATFIYDQDLGIWYRWSNTAGTGKFPIVGVALVRGVFIEGLGSDGFVHQISNQTYQDNNVNFPVVIQGNPLTFCTMARKFYNRAELIGDKQNSTANALLSFTDDDYTTFSPTRVYDMSQTRVFTRNLSNSRRRAWKLSYSGNTAMRVLGLEFTIELDVS